MKGVKIFVGFVVAVIAVIAIIAVIGLQNLDKIIQSTVEEVGPKIVGTEVRLQDVELSLTEGKAALSGLSIKNPAGFSNADAFSLGSIGVQLDTSTITGDVIVIKDVYIDQMVLLAELKGLTDTNLQALLNNVQSNMAGDANSSTPTEPESASQSSSVRLAVEQFRFAKSQLLLQSDQFGEQKITLPTISLSDLGTKEKGLTPQELGAVVMEKLLKTAKDAASDRLEDIAKDKAKEKLSEKLKDKLGDDGAGKLNQLKSLFGQ